MSAVCLYNIRLLRMTGFETGMDIKQRDKFGMIDKTTRIKL